MRGRSHRVDTRRAGGIAGRSRSGVQCTTMTNLKVAEARARFGEILDEAERGAPVVIERRGIRFRLIAERERPGKRSETALFDFVDPAVLTGQWTWKAGARGLAFSPRRKRP